ncbi:MAG: CHAT domain-containing tetratricopeptide repeat protein [Acidobacteriota bacterium]
MPVPWKSRLAYYQKSLEIDRAMDRQVNVAMALQGMANIYREQGRPERALAFLQDSLAIYRSAGQKRGIASALNNIASSRMVLGEYDRALEGYGQSLALYEELKDPAGMAYVLGNTGLVHLVRGDAAKALEPLGRSLAVSEERGDKRGIALALAWLAASHNALSNFDRAASLATRAAGMARTMEAPFVLWQACAALGQSHSALRQPESARAAFDEAIRAVEGLRREVAGDESERAAILANMASPYQGMVELEVEQSHAESALSYAERAKGRVLLEILQHGREDIDSAMSAGEREEERKQKAAVASLNARLTRELQRTNLDRDRIAGLKADLERARLQLEAFEANVYALHPELRVRRGELSMPSAGEAVRILPGAAGAFLEFVVTESRTYLFAVTRHDAGDAAGASVHIYPVAIGLRDLSRKIERFRRQIAERDLNFRASAAELFDLLLGPARGELRGRNYVVIVPDGPLWDLPFQALMSAGKYLWEQHEISYAPSLAVLREMVTLRGRRAAQSAAPPGLLAMGGSLPRGSGGTEAGTLSAGDGMARSGVENQVKQIVSLYGNRARLYLGEGASEARFKREAGSYGIIHLTTHGILVDSNPMYSHLTLSPGRGEDGDLEAREILRLRLNADLVVLSACETARGRAGAGEGMIGLSWALFVAGCPAAVVSQWKVDVAATTGLMVAFHRLLQAARPRLSRAAALRNAALEVMRDPRYRHPYYWAGFILVGDGS